MSEKDTEFQKFADRAKGFKDAEDGAVSVDWVVLTAAAVGMAAGAGNTISDAISTLGGSIETEIAAKEVSNGD